MQSMADEPARLRILSFAIHSARGVIRDQSTRRRVMFTTLVMAMLMLFFGTTFLQTLLSPRDHPGCFILFWVACASLTLTAFLLALLGLLMMRAQYPPALKIFRESLGRACTH